MGFTKRNKRNFISMSLNARCGIMLNTSVINFFFFYLQKPITLEKIISPTFKFFYSI